MKILLIDSLLGFILVSINRYLMTFLVTFSPGIAWLHEFSISKNGFVITFLFTIIFIGNFFVGITFSIAFFLIRSNFSGIELMATLMLPLIINLIINFIILFLSSSSFYKKLETRINNWIPDESLKEEIRSFISITDEPVYDILGYISVFFESLLGYLCAGLIVLKFTHLL